MFNVSPDLTSDKALLFLVNASNKIICLIRHRIHDKSIKIVVLLNILIFKLNSNTHTHNYI